MKPEATTPENLAHELSECLGNVVVFKFLAHGFHWNVRGPQFHQFHELFSSVYEDADSAVDPLAENIRKLGFDAPYLLTDLVRLSEIQPRGISTNDPLELASALHAANNVVLECLVETFGCANALNEQGIANFLAERIDAHQKWRWQLGTIIGADSTRPSAQARFDLDDEPTNALGHDAPLDDAYATWGDPEQGIVIMASAHGVNPAILRAAYRRAVKASENPVERVTELAVKKYESRDADLLPRR